MEQNKNDVKKAVDPKDAEKEAKKLEQREARKSALLTLKELCDKTEDKKYQKALTIIKPSLYGLARSSSGGTNAVLSSIIEKGTMSEMDIFKEHKIGRREMAGHIRKALKKAEPKDRVWIDFDVNTGMYKVVGKGENAPKDWKGYVPVQENIELK